MKKSVPVWPVLLIGLLIAACQNQAEPKVSLPGPVGGGANLHDAVTAFAPGWNTYRSQTKGYTLQIPEQTRVWSCMDKSGFAMAPVGVYSSAKFDYVAPSEFYLNVEGKCVKNKTTFDYLDGVGVSADNPPVSRWKIVFADAANQEDIDKFIKAEYGKNCAFIKTESHGKGSLEDVVMKTTGPDEPDATSCFINWITELKYDSVFKKIAKWDIGQDANFFDKNGAALDEKMAESFVFEKNL